MSDRNVPRALILNPAWSSTLAVEAMRLWSELPDGASGTFDVAAAAERAQLSPEGLRDALALLLQSGLLEESPRGYTRQPPAQPDEPPRDRP